MKRRNFFMSLVALATGVKVAPVVTAVETPGERWRRQVQELIEARRRDPNAIHSVPFPVSYQELQ